MKVYIIENLDEEIVGVISDKKYKTKEDLIKALGVNPSCYFFITEEEVVENVKELGNKIRVMNFSLGE